MAGPIPIRPAEPRDLAAITRIYDHAVRHGTASFEIEPPDEDTMYVAASSQRRGIGRALLERLIADAEVGGFRQMIAVIGDSANVGSIELHRAAGFRMVGTFDNVGFKFGRWLDSVLMQRPLGSGATAMP